MINNMEKECKICNKIFQKRITCSKKNWVTNIYCSPECRMLSYPPKITKECLNCSKEFSVKNYRKDIAFFCSQVCSWKFRDEGKRSKEKKIRQSWAYKIWRKNVFERDNFTCQNCGVKNGCGKSIYFNADHIKPFALYPELRFSIDNGRTLCVDCHKKTGTYGRGAIFRKQTSANGCIATA